MDLGIVSTDNMSDDEHSQRQRKHVFCVNGFPSFLDLVREIMQDEHYNVTTTNFVERTYEQIAALQPDLVIVDIAIGIQSGWDLLEQLHHYADTADLPVLVTSTNQTLLDRIGSDHNRFGGDSFIVKPFDIDVLIAAVSELIGPA